jgi:hypothetical protein
VKLEELRDGRGCQVNMKTRQRHIKYHNGKCLAKRIAEKIGHITTYIEPKDLVCFFNFDTPGAAEANNRTGGEDQNTLSSAALMGKENQLGILSFVFRMGATPFSTHQGQ